MLVQDLLQLVMSFVLLTHVHDFQVFFCGEVSKKLTCCLVKELNAKRSCGVLHPSIERVDWLREESLGLIDCAEVSRGFRVKLELALA